MCLQMLCMMYCCLHAITSSVSLHNSSRKLASSLHPSPISLSLLFPNSTVSRHFGPFFKLLLRRTSFIAFPSIPRDRSRNGVNSKDEPLLPNSCQMVMNHFVRRFQLLRDRFKYLLPAIHPRLRLILFCNSFFHSCWIVFTHYLCSLTMSFL